MKYIILIALLLISGCRTEEVVVEIPEEPKYKCPEGKLCQTFNGWVKMDSSLEPQSIKSKSGTWNQTYSAGITLGIFRKLYGVS